MPVSSELLGNTQNSFQTHAQRGANIVMRGGKKRSRTRKKRGAGSGQVSIYHFKKGNDTKELKDRTCSDKGKTGHPLYDKILSYETTKQGADYIYDDLIKYATRSVGENKEKCDGRQDDVVVITYTIDENTITKFKKEFKKIQCFVKEPLFQNFGVLEEGEIEREQKQLETINDIQKGLDNEKGESCTKTGLLEGLSWRTGSTRSKWIQTPSSQIGGGGYDTDGHKIGRWWALYNLCRYEEGRAERVDYEGLTGFYEYMFADGVPEGGRRRRRKSRKKRRKSRKKRRKSRKKRKRTRRRKRRR